MALEWLFSLEIKSSCFKKLKIIVVILSSCLMYLKNCQDIKNLKEDQISSSLDSVKGAA